MTIQIWSGYSVTLDRTVHPRFPELKTHHSAALHLWLVAHDGRWTFYPEGLGASSGDTPERAFEQMFADLQCTVTGPYVEDERRQKAAEALGDFA